MVVELVMFIVLLVDLVVVFVLCFTSHIFKYWKTLAPSVVMFTATPQLVKYCWSTFIMWYVSFFFSLKIDDHLECLSDMAR